MIEEAILPDRYRHFFNGTGMGYDELGRIRDWALDLGHVQLVGDNLVLSSKGKAIVDSYREMNDMPPLHAAYQELDEMMSASPEYSGP